MVFFPGTKRRGSAFGSVVNEAGRKKMYTDMSENNPKSAFRQQIDENLKRIYDEMLEEPLPDRMMQLLDQLRVKAEKRAPADETGDVPHDEGGNREQS
jgi:hypothetical protein